MGLDISVYLVYGFKATDVFKVVEKQVAVAHYNERTGERLPDRTWTDDVIVDKETGKEYADMEEVMLKRWQLVDDHKYQNPPAGWYYAVNASNIMGAVIGVRYAVIHEYNCPHVDSAPVTLPDDDIKAKFAQIFPGMTGKAFVVVGVSW